MTENAKPILHVSPVRERPGGLDGSYVSGKDVEHHEEEIAEARQLGYAVAPLPFDADSSEPQHAIGSTCWACTSQEVRALAESFTCEWCGARADRKCNSDGRLPHEERVRKVLGLQARSQRRSRT